MNLDDEIAKLMSEFAALMEKRQSHMSHDDLSITGFRLITLAYYHGEPYSMKELARAANILLPSASVMIEKLEASGYVARQHSKADRRVIHVHLTAKSLKLIEGKINQTQEALKQAFAGRSDVDKAVVLEFFHSYIETLRIQAS